MIAIGNFLFRYRNGLFPLVYLLLLPGSSPVFHSFRVSAALGLAIALSGQILRAVTIGLDYIVRGGKNRRVYAEELVQGGVFAHCRNPLYVGNFLILLGVGVASNSTLFLTVAIPFFVFAYAAIIAAEEDFLQKKFGEQFTRYCQRVNRIIPNFSGIGRTLTGMRFNSRRLITAEYGSTFIWVAAITLVTLKNLWLSGEYRSDPFLACAAWTALGLAAIAYAIARFLKKSGILAPN